MAMRSAIPRFTSSRFFLMPPRYFSDSSGRILGEEERAKENVYIQKMEREKLEKLKKKLEKEKAALEKEKADFEKEKAAFEKEKENKA